MLEGGGATLPSRGCLTLKDRVVAGVSFFLRCATSCFVLQQGTGVSLDQQVCLSKIYTALAGVWVSCSRLARYC